MPSDSRPTSPTTTLSSVRFTRPRAWNSCTICRMPTSRHRTTGGGFFRENGGGQMGGSLGPQDFEQKPKKPRCFGSVSIVNPPPFGRFTTAWNQAKFSMGFWAQHDFLDSTTSVFQKAILLLFHSNHMLFTAFSPWKNLRFSWSPEIFPERNELKSDASYWGFPQKTPCDVFFL